MSKVSVRCDGLITISQAAQLCGVTTVSVYHWIERGLLPVTDRRHPMLVNLLDVARAELATRGRADRREPKIPADWQYEFGYADLDAVFAVCASAAAQSPATPGEVVYYLSFADRIKIGTTVNIRERLRALPHDRLLATEPGGAGLEHERHAQFASARLSGEWFTSTPALLAHIRRLRRRSSRATLTGQSAPSVASAAPDA
jgi:hypothetical protein